jgi:hypothetical protein
MADYVKVNSDGTQSRVFTEGSVTSANTSAKKVNVTNVAELEAAVAAQTAGQFIYLAPGTYNLTKSLGILVAADGGGLIGEGIVVINGIAAADEAIKINTALATGTFEYTIGGGIETKGGSGKIALKIVNGSSTQKTIVYVNGTANFLDNAAGKAVSIVNTGTGAIRFYVNGQGQGFDSIAITPAVADDRFTFNNISIDEIMVIAATPDVAAHYFFSNCRIKHEGITGGGAASVKSAAYCWTEAAADNFIPVVLDTNDFTGAATETILQGS